MDDTFGVGELTAELTLDEGRVAVPYHDSRGIITVGIGINLSNGLSDAAIDFLYAEKVVGALHDLDAHVPWWRTLPAAKQRVMIGLAYNMGWPVFSQFVRFLAAMQARNWLGAAAELKNSDWWGQVGERGPNVVARLLTP